MISEKELEGIRKFISHEVSGSNLGKVLIPMESTSPELQHNKKSLNFTIPIDNNREAILVRIATGSPEMRRQVQATSGRIRVDSTTGDYSPHDGVHLREISVQMDGGIADGENSGEKLNQTAGVHENSGNVKYSPPLETHPLEISRNFDGKHTTTNQANRSNDSMKNVHEGTNRNMYNTEGSGSLPISLAEINIQLDANHQLGARTSHEEGNAIHDNILDEQQANDQATRILDSENSSDSAYSSIFSFGIKSNSTNINTTPITYPMQVVAIQDRPTEETGQVQQQRKDQSGQLKQAKGKELQTGNLVTKISTQSLAANTEAQSHNVINEHISRTVEVSKQVQNQGHKDNEGKQDQANMEYHNNFRKISNNYTRYVPNPQRNRDDASKVNNDVALNNGKQPNAQQQSQDQNTNKSDRIPKPAPFTIVQSFAAHLRYNQSKNEIPIVLDAPIHTLAEFCKHTLVGKFTNTMPKMELIRRSFTLQTQLTGGVKISHYNSRHVYIDLDNEFDYVTLWTKQKMSIEGQIMRIQAWTPEFTPEEETPIVPIWVALPELPWHCYNKVLLSTLLESIGKVDLTKARPSHIWMGFKNSDQNKGRW
ncbi:hypothetical protein H5410_027640 [Solanum commersonii]|uniref:DUF4283 domain-containing protein n=1 Tax=Solanum commersonii TaxID=4109 RepID=A0A9J5Z3Y3_SOLCO|nr:hypothetical protein H5410_027640 [Solanum commersonii]